MFVGRADEDVVLLAVEFEEPFTAEIVDVAP